MTTQLQLISGQKIPTIAYGTARKLFPDSPDSLLDVALEAGYRHIDTGHYYGNEEHIGRVLKRWLSSGKLKREDLFVSTKLPSFHLHPDKIEASIKSSLRNLGLDYVDMYLFHHSMYTETPENLVPQPPDFKPPAMGKALPTDHIACWKKMEEQVDAGRVRHIGLSNFGQRQVDRIWQTARIKPACLQTELSPFLQEPELVKYCQNKGIVVEGYGMVRITPDAKHLIVFDNPTIKKLSEKYNKSPALITFRFFLQKNVISIMGGDTADIVKQNLEVYNFSIDSADMKLLEALDLGQKGRKAHLGGASGYLKYRDHPEYPFAIPTDLKT